jgi:hypothetical protein
MTFTGVDTGRPTEKPSRESAGDGGWLLFAGFALITASIMRFFDGIWAFRYHGALPDNLENALFGHSLSTYGWVWMGVAAVLFVCGLAVMVRSQFARWIGIFAGALGAISAIWWMPYYPVWSLTYIAIGMLVVYALAAHGQREVAQH